MTDDDRHIVLVRRPRGVPDPADFRLERRKRPVPAHGQLLVRNRVLAIDPAIRGFLDDRPSYMPPVALGETVRGMVLGEILESRLAGFAPGDIVRALAGWEEHSVLGADAIGLEKCRDVDRRRLSLSMGTLGPSGLTAYVGLFAIGGIRPGETVAVSAAAGAVGNVAGQIAKLSGCRVIGLVGGEAKAEVARALGFDAVVDHRASEGLESQLDAAAPEGIDVYFDNVGGRILDAMLPRLREGGRVVICGMISNYNDADDPYPIRNLWQILVKRATMRGFLTYEHPEFLGEAAERIGRWVEQGSLRPLENVTHGLENAPAAFIRLMQGETVGKTVVCLD